MSRNLSTWVVFWTNQVQMGQNVVGRWREGGGLQVPSGPWLMLGVCSLSVQKSCMKHCLYLFLYMTVRQCYEKSVVQMDNLRRLLDIRRMDRVPNARIKELCGVKKGLDERIDEGMLRWFDHVERDRIAKRVHVGDCAGSHSVCRLRKRWTDTVEVFKEKRFGC